MIYVFDSEICDSDINCVLAWSRSCADVDLWRGRSDRPGQYRFDWRIRVQGRTEVLFLLQFSSLDFKAEPDYVDPARL